MDEKLQPLNTQPKKQKAALTKLVVTAGALSLCGLLLYNFLNPAGDELSQDERSKITENMKNISAFPLQVVTENEWDQALASIPLDQNKKAELLQDLHRPVNQLNQQVSQSKLKLEEDVTQLAWINLWDFADQDGDVIQVSSAGYSVQINLLNAPTRIAVPINFNRIVLLTGLADGGGGITLGVSAASSQNLVIEPGTSFSLPVSY